ncbi:hypothetical protein SAMN05216231_2703 [Virgibacillus salinus]|uniref:Uncharacterized protein n=1 Tax=Virgibacillus salinus TaxID=553311 RepID=A0A1H1E342_9BACI|nr:hypothetical protein SAMN05216231_2703 [Virgibacillus salinus]
MSFKKRLLIAICFFGVSLTFIFWSLKPSVFQSFLLIITAMCASFILKWRRKDNENR